MVESAEFLSSLEHANPERPRFSILPGTETMLQVDHRGHSIQVPMSEILNFASRWQADFIEQQKATRAANRLPVFPYPLYHCRLDDPDRGAGWAVP